MLVALASAKGSPGVSTAAVALGAIWPRDVVVADMDPSGGDLALRHRTPDQGPLDAERGLLSLAAAARRGLEPGEVREHIQRADGGLDLLLGVSSPEQVTGIGPVWPLLADALGSLSGTDTIVDCGRVVPGSPTMPVLAAADAVVFLVHPTLESYAHLRERLRWLQAPLQLGLPGGVRVGVAIQTDIKDAAATRDLDRLLQYAELPVTVLGRIAHDPKAADTLAGRGQRSLQRSLLLRSARELAQGVTRFAGAPSPVLH